MKTYLGISFLVMGLFGLVSGLHGAKHAAPLGLLFCVCGGILVDLFKELRRDHP